MKRLLMVAMMALIAGSAYAQLWDVSHDEDLMSGKTQTFVMGYAEVSRGTLRDAVIVLRFAGDELDAYVYWGGYNMESPPLIALKFGDDAPEIIRGTLSTSREATFFPDPWYILDKMVELGPDGRVVIQAERNTGVMSTARWIVGDLASQIETLVDR